MATKETEVQKPVTETAVTEQPVVEKSAQEIKPVASLTKEKPATDVKETKTATATEGPKRTKLMADDDEIPEDAELLELTNTALKRRLERHTKAELRNRFGTDKPDEIKAKLDRLAELEGAEEARKREAMSEKERLENDLKTERRAREDAERRARMAEDDRVVEKEGDRISRLLGRHIEIEDDEDFREAVFKKLARHLKSEFTEEEMLNLKDGEIEKWAKNYIKDHPRHAKEVQAAIKKEPFTNGGDTRERAAPTQRTGTGGGGRSFAPSAENPMTTNEARAEAGKQGLHW